MDNELLPCPFCGGEAELYGVPHIPSLFGSCEYKEVFESVFGYGMIDNFGKTVFPTREEAEAALEGMQHE